MTDYPLKPTQRHPIAELHVYGHRCYRKQMQMSYHGDGEAPNVVDVLDAVLPGDKTLDVDVELIPQGLDRLIVLLIPVSQQRKCV